jgi:RNA 3'-terminal phosphate cyclase-like protein
VDLIRTVTLPHLQPFGIVDGLELRVCTMGMNDTYVLMTSQIKKRGAAPLGGGEVQLLCPVVKTVSTLNFVDPGKIKRIRGIA